LRLRDKKKTQNKKRKYLFDLRLFCLSRGEEKGKKEKPREEKQRKNNTLTSK